LRLGFALTVTILLSQIRLDPLEFVFYDWRATTLPASENSGAIVLIGIDDDTLARLKRAPVAIDFTQALVNLQAATPHSIITLVKPTEILGTQSEMAQFAKVAAQSELIYAQNDMPSPGQRRLESLPAPFAAIRTEAAPLTHDRSLLIRDGVSRRVILEYQNAWTLQAKLAQSLNELRDLRSYHGVFEYLNSEQAYVRFKKGFTHLSFSDAVENRIDPSKIDGKIIIIGRDSKSSASNFLTAPSSLHELDMSPMEVQANYIDSLITNSSPYLTPTWFTAILTFLLSLLTMLIVLRLRPVAGLMAVVVSLTLVILFSFVADFALNWFFPIASPILGILVCFYFVLPYRLILENRLSWEYYEKNRLLTQVEELKSNFIRLMSHDLKTPIARIQAMAEIVMQDKDRLTSDQTQALDNITRSSEELSQFIASILNLSRIQSKKVKLALKTRDINQLLQKVIANCEHLAKRKNIQVVTELEPLFSVRLDEDLMKQVFTNLIENAIKYSPENRQVTISATEIDNKIQVRISDQGIGIPKEDLPYVFERFYRAQNAEFENSGTGLGLYLAKYFVNLHSGSIEVQSEHLVGSTFSVSLPIDMEDGIGLEKGAAHV
jgi:signal transduction histidine kinase